MPEILKQQNYSVCDRLDNFCQDCIANNYQDCSDHGGRPSGDSTVLGKRRVGDNAFEDYSMFWNKKGEYKKKGDTKPASKRTNASAEARAALAKNTNTIIDQNGGQDPSEGQDPAGADVVDQDNLEPGSVAHGGGVRFRESLKKFVVEYRPSRFKWKLWMGTYPTKRDGQRAYDCAKYYAGQEKGQFYFPDSPGLFAKLGPLTRPFSVVSRESKDKAFNQELKKRAKEVIKKETDAKNKLQRLQSKGPAPSAHARSGSPIVCPSMFEDVEHMLRGNQTPATIQVFDHISTSSQEFGVLTPESVATADPYFQGSAAAEVPVDVIARDELKSSKEAVPVAREYADSAFEGLDTLEPLPEVHHQYPCFVHVEPEVHHHQHQSPYYVAEYDMMNGVNQYQTLTSSFQIPWDSTGDQDSEEDMCLWDHDR